MKKRWFASMLIAGFMTMGIVGGAALANSHDADGESPQSGLIARVAAILGLEQTQVEEAFEQAKGEIRDEAVQNRLDNLVESSRLTQAKADEYQEWYGSRPEGVSPCRGHGHRVIGGRGFGGPRAHGPGQIEAPAEEAAHTAFGATAL